MEAGRLERLFGVRIHGENHSAVLELKDKLKGLKSWLMKKLCCHQSRYDCSRSTSVQTRFDYPVIKS